MVFRPEPIANRVYCFSEELVAFSTETESEYVRADEESVRFPFGSSLRRALSRLEAISTASITGPVPDLRQMIWLLSQDVQGKISSGKVPKGPFDLAPDVVEATRVAFRYQKVIEGIALTSPQHRVTEKELIDRHLFLAHGIYRNEENRGEFHYRRQPLSPKKPGGDCIGKTYVPPSPDEVPLLMRDLFAYLRTPRLTPTMQAAVAHFQLQAICPFASSMDRTERCLSLSILHQRGVSKHLIPTIGFPLASGYDNYRRLLMPYRYASNSIAFDYLQALDKWIRCCVSDLGKSVQVVRAYMASLRKIDAYYRARLGSLRQGSALDVLVRELPGLPILDSSSAMELTGKRFSAVSEAINVLVDKGILRQIGDSQRNRLYEAPDIIQNEQRILDTSLPAHTKKHHDPNF
ncbi:MAG: Fic family protein [Coriobacteriales bacterium]|jgi:Fic family protein